ncbi:MAG: tetratricopeptide repeat protein, partial [Polyangiales bacterium]
EHAGAKALAARIENTVSKGDPLPPEEGSGAGSARTVPVGPGPGPSVGAGDTYDSILRKANKLAESNCAKAAELYAKALEQKPNGVEALTGMGYCHIDAKQFASAFSKFRAALAISSRYEPALWGVAEAYTQQGRKEQALEAVKAYLEAYPGSPKGIKALDRLGGGATPEKPPEKPPEGSGSSTPPTPTPTPTAPETGAGSGSG